MQLQPSGQVFEQEIILKIQYIEVDLNDLREAWHGGNCR